ncbi:hypothetical protein [Marilutibacter maris]|uniref:Uncharacterized protein n=1 Tax=Marilutibacter maris TaxID=1605891 RepID=A0A508AZ79_9GAMM|nr:hypothetical protein [Lysobacter maris]KAB8195625.1 hypothetical protein FKV24_004975 [Lysobacter maris]
MEVKIALVVAEVTLYYAILAWLGTKLAAVVARREIHRRTGMGDPATWRGAVAITLMVSGLLIAMQLGLLIVELQIPEPIPVLIHLYWCVAMVASFVPSMKTKARMLEEAGIDPMGSV